MNPRNRRAIILLILWCGCFGIYLLAERGLALRKEWVLRTAILQRSRSDRMGLEREVARLAKIRERNFQSFPKEWQGLSEDQFRLKGQDGVLAAAQKCGLGSVRLRSETVDPSVAGRQLAWALEGEGTLTKWIEAMEAVERSQPFMAILSYRLDLPGDPWRSEAMDGQGPILKGSITCYWVIRP